MKIAGVLSGTSLDGIDVAVCDVVVRHVDVRDGDLRGTDVRVSCERFTTVPFDDGLRARILAALPPAAAGAFELSSLHAAIGDAFGEAVREAAGGAALDAVASHGVTIAHDGDAHVTLQLGNAFRIRERAGVTVVYDFRSADTAAGGHGAPLVPFVDTVLFARHAPCVAVNLGGIANITVLPDGIAFDAGPANLPIDTYIQLRSGGDVRCDRDGALARSGTSDIGLLRAMLDDAYFARRPPKTTGRERYGNAFAARWRSALDELSLPDALATVTALSAASLASAIARFAPRAQLAILSGGGARNGALVDAIGGLLPGVRVEISDAFGIDADAKEAIAFAVLGAMTLHERPANLVLATGARGPRVLGAIAPHHLEALLARCREERAGEPPDERTSGPHDEPEKHAR